MRGPPTLTPQQSLCCVGQAAHEDDPCAAVTGPAEDALGHPRPPQAPPARASLPSPCSYHHQVHHQLDGHSRPREQNLASGSSRKARKLPRPSPGLPQPALQPPRLCVASLGLKGSGLRGMCRPEARDAHHSRSSAGRESQACALLESPTAQPHRGPSVRGPSKPAGSRSRS